MHRHHAMRPDCRLQGLVPFGRYEEQVRIRLARGFNYGSETRGLHHARMYTLTNLGWNGNKRVTNADAGSLRKNHLQSQGPNCITRVPLKRPLKLRHRCRGFRPAFCSGGGKSSPLSFSTFGGRCFPAGPSFEPGEIGIAELLRFTLPDRVRALRWAHQSPDAPRALEGGIDA